MKNLFILLLAPVLCLGCDCCEGKKDVALENLQEEQEKWTANVIEIGDESVITNIPAEEIRILSKPENIQRVKKLYVQYSLVEREEDVWIEDGQLHVRMTKKCEPPKVELKNGKLIPNTPYHDSEEEKKKLVEMEKQQAIYRCMDWCSAIGAIAVTMCEGLPLGCKCICASTVSLLINKCNRCCQTGKFQENCVEPLKQFFPPPCDPAWD